MNLREIVDILKAGCEPLPCDLVSLLARLKEGGPKNKQDFIYQGRELRAIFTQDIIPPDMKRVWHLSIGVLDGQPLKDEMVMEIVAEFFSKPIEMPATLHPRKFVRHFIELVEPF